MARKSNADTAKDKAAKQKKIVIGLAVFLALAVAYAVHTMSGLNGGSAATKPQAVAAGAAPAPAPAPAASTPAPAAPSLAGNPAATATPSTPAATSAPSSTDSSQLVSVVVPTADPGQLESFSHFESKDPFASASSTPTSGSSGAGTKGSSGSSGPSGSSGSGSPPKTPPAPPAPPPTTAVISVNGTSESVTSGMNFPAANPVSSTNGLFQLVSLTAHSATVTIVGGSYASGSQTLTLTENKPVTLVNTADGTRYTLVLYPQGTAAPASPASGSSAPGSSGSSGSSAPSSSGTTTPGG